MARRLCCAVLAGNTGLLQHSFRGCCRRAVPGLSLACIASVYRTESAFWVLNSKSFEYFLFLLDLSGVAVLEFHITSSWEQADL